MYLVDTDWLASYLNGRSDAVQLLDSLQPGGLAISMMSYGEIYEGIYAHHDPPAKERGFQQVLQVIEVRPLTRTVMKRFARLRGQLRRQGLLIPDADLLIAATALTHGLTLVTRNRRHFERIPGLTLHPAP